MMIKCKYCGTDVDDESKYCLKCGKIINETNDDVQPIDGKSKFFAALSYIYLGPVFLVPLIFKRKDNFVRFHVKRGIITYAMLFIEIIIATTLFSSFPMYTYEPKLVTSAIDISYSTVLKPVFSTTGIVIHIVFYILIAITMIVAMIGFIKAIRGKKSKKCR